VGKTLDHAGNAVAWTGVWSPGVNSLAEHVRRAACLGQQQQQQVGSIFLFAEGLCKDPVLWLGTLSNLTAAGAAAAAAASASTKGSCTTFSMHLQLLINLARASGCAAVGLCSSMHHWEGCAGCCMPGWLARCVNPSLTVSVSAAGVCCCCQGQWQGGYGTIRSGRCWRRQQQQQLVGAADGAEERLPPPPPPPPPGITAAPENAGRGELVTG